MRTLHPASGLAALAALGLAAAGSLGDGLMPMKVAQCQPAASPNPCKSDGGDVASFEVELTPGATYDVAFESSMVPGSLELLGARIENGAAATTAAAGWTTDGLGLIVAFDSAETRFIPISRSLLGLVTSIGPAALTARPGDGSAYSSTELRDLHRSSTVLVAVELVGNSSTVPKTGVWLKLRLNGRPASAPWMCPLSHMHRVKVFQHSGFEMTRENGVLVNRNLRCIVRSLAALFEAWGIRYVNDCGGMVATYNCFDIILDRHSRPLPPIPSPV